MSRCVSPLVALARRARAVALLGGAFVLGAPVAEAQGRVLGRVSGPAGAIADATVSIRAIGRRAVTAVDGAYRFEAVPAGRYQVEVRAIGFLPQARPATVGAGPGATVRVDFALVPAPQAIDPLVVTGTLRETAVSESPVRVDVVSARFLQRNLTNNLTESVQSLNGVSQQVDCGVCYTNSIRINGMEGPYTSVLIDGMPIMSSLATVYGLNGINPAVVEQVEIIKGPASTLYGSEAMAGVINVITKDPRFAPRLSASSYGTSHGETSLDFAVAPSVGGTSTLLSGSVARNGSFIDENGDNFSDVPKLTRVAVFNKWSVGTAARRTLDLAAKYYHEDRFGGTRQWRRADRGTDRAYGELIHTNRVELIGAWQPAALARRLRVEGSYNWHDQDSWYGTTRYRARQHVAYGQLSWAGPAGPAELVAGATLRHQRYDDNTPATPAADRRTTPGVFAQAETAVTDDLTLLGGLRLDHHQSHGVVTSPRLSARWRPAAETTVRVNLATGFRVVNLFTEDHAAISGIRTVTIAEELRPERSFTTTVSLNQLIPVRSAALALDVDGFQTRFSNKIQPDYNTDPDRIIYDNLDGHAVTRGLAVALTLAPEQWPLSFRLGGTFQDVYTVENGVETALEFAPDFKGELTTSYELPAAGLTLDWTGRLLGPMQLPRFPGRATRSPWFSEHAVQVTKSLGRNTFVIAGVKNLFDYTQRDPLIAPEDPFGPDFDTYYVYGPTQGRRLLLGVQHNVERPR